MPLGHAAVAVAVGPADIDRLAVGAGMGLQDLRQKRHGSPTLLYEDHSIRFAGIQRISAQSAVSQYAGYSRDWLKGREIATVQAASTDCALIPAKLFLEAGGFSATSSAPTSRAWISA